MPSARPLAARFAEKYQIAASGCWLWTASLDAHGYGRINHGGAIRLAHRISYELHVGHITQGMDICHKCDTPACVNPAHLFLGTQADNLRDAANKGRTCKGERNGHAKLTADDVRTIRRIYKPRDRQFGTRALGRRYGVSYAAVRDAISGRNWKDLPWE